MNALRRRSAGHYVLSSIKSLSIKCTVYSHTTLLRDTHLRYVNDTSIIRHKSRVRFKAPCWQLVSCILSNVTVEPLAALLLLQPNTSLMTRLTE